MKTVKNIGPPVPYGSVPRAMAWMGIWAVVLCWLPGLGAAIAGYVGGGMAGGLRKAVLAALLPGLLLGGAMYLAAPMLVGLPLVGAVAALGGTTLAVWYAGSLLIGAIAGVLL